jgi:ubiquinone/menaquinone biosynthesis C-methylase UbiE
MKEVSAFERHADRYDAWFVKNRAVYDSELRAVKALLPDGGKGLEIGVGSGLFAAPLGITRGIDPSRTMLEKAKARGIDAVQGVAESLPFQDNDFDYALMVTTVCFLDDIDLAFREVYRVLTPGGAFLIGFVDRNSPLGRSYEEKKDQSVFYKDATFYTVPAIVEHLTLAGFSSFQFVQTLFNPLPDIREVEPARPGYGDGSFVVVRAGK